MSSSNDIHCYDDIINFPHHQSATRPHMSMHDRAAQFAPFAALTGHADAIAETARLAEARIEMDDFEKKLIFEDGDSAPIPEIVDIQRK